MRARRTQTDGQNRPLDHDRGQQADRTRSSRRTRCAAFVRSDPAVDTDRGADTPHLDALARQPIWTPRSIRVDSPGQDKIINMLYPSSNVKDEVCRSRL